MMLAFLPALLVMIIMGEWRKGNFDIWNMIVEMSGAIPVYGIFIYPFTVLSIFNRFTFGKILGVACEDTLFLENREILIKDIVEIVYHPRVMSRVKFNFSYATFVVRLDENEIEAFDVIHFPMYGLRKIKKINKQIKLKCDKYTWLFILCPTVIFAVIGFFFG